MPLDLMQTTMEDSNPTEEATATKDFDLSMEVTPMEETATKGLHMVDTNRCNHIVATTNDLLPMVATLLATKNSQFTSPKDLSTETVASPRSLLTIKSQPMDVNPTALRMAATVLQSK